MANSGCPKAPRARLSALPPSRGRGYGAAARALALPARRPRARRASGCSRTPTGILCSARRPAGGTWDPRQDRRGLAGDGVPREGRGHGARRRAQGLSVGPRARGARARRARGARARDAPLPAHGRASRERRDLVEGRRCPARAFDGVVSRDGDARGRAARRAAPARGQARGSSRDTVRGARARVARRGARARDRPSRCQAGQRFSRAPERAGGRRPSRMERLENSWISGSR